MIVRVLGLLLAGVILGSSSLFAQPLRPAISASLGFVETLQTDPGAPRFAVFPRVEMATVLARSDRAGLALLGSAYAGGWRDGVDEALGCADCITYAQSSLVVGARLGAALEAFPLPLALWSGFSRHFVFAEHISGSDYAWSTGQDHRTAFNALEGGTRLQVPLGAHLRAGGEALVYVALPRSENMPHAVRMGYGLVLTYALPR